MKRLGYIRLILLGKTVIIQVDARPILEQVGLEGALSTIGNNK